MARIHPSHIDQWVRVFVSSKQLLKEGTWSCQDHLVCFHLLTILTGQSHISKVIVLSQTAKSTFDVILKVIPLETELFTKHLLVLMDLFFSCYAISKFGLDWNGFTIGYDVSTALRVVFWPTPFLTMLTASRSGWIASCLWQDIDVIWLLNSKNSWTIALLHCVGNIDGHQNRNFMIQNSFLE